MKMSVKLVLTVIATAVYLATASTIVWAEEEDDSYTGYESIVSQLRSAADTTPQIQSEDINWEEVALHGGIGITTSFVHVASPEGANGSGIMKGFEAHFGVNLFTRKARVEGIFRNYAQEDLSSDMTADLKEFEFRGVFLPSMPDKMRLRLGLGLSARYMDISARSGGKWTPHKASTPASSFMIGFERKISATVAIGPDLTYRSALISETFDKSSWDASLRLNATF